MMLQSVLLLGVLSNTAAAQVRFEVYQDGTPVFTEGYSAGAVTCGLPFAPETVQPDEAPAFVRWPDPADQAKDCEITVAPYMGQFQPRQGGYRAAVDAGQGFGALSPTAFLMAAQPQPTPPPSVCTEPENVSLTVRRRQSVTLAWCQPLVDEAGLPVTIEEYRLYRDGLRAVSNPVAGAETAAGVPVTVAWSEADAGVYVYTLRAVSGGLEGPDSVALTVTVQSGRPVGSGRGRVTSP